MPFLGSKFLLPRGRPEASAAAFPLYVFRKAKWCYTTYWGEVWTSLLTGEALMEILCQLPPGS